eukprot:5670094-Pyramimonas_sp.AAC.1
MAAQRLPLDTSSQFAWSAWNPDAFRLRYPSYQLPASVGGDRGGGGGGEGEGGRGGAGAGAGVG